MRRFSLIRALHRIARGFGGTSLILGPVLVIVLSVAKVVPVATVIVMAISVALLYAIAVLKSRRHGMSFIKAVAKDTVLTFAFYVLGAVIVGVVAAVSGVRSNDIPFLVLLFPFLGFWILEALRSEPGGNEQMKRLSRL
jgi:hypothetical protein